MKSRCIEEKDFYFLSSELREADKNEIEKVTHSANHLNAIYLSYRYADICKVIVDKDNQPIFVYGVDNDGRIWALGTKKIEKNKVNFLKIVKKDFELLKKRYNVLYNYVDSDNTSHVEFIKHFGFELDKSNKQKHSGVDFYYFSIDNKKLQEN